MAREGKGVDVTDDIQGIIGKVLKIEPGRLTAETRLSEFAPDSLDVMEMVFMFEEKFDISMVLEPTKSSFTVKLERGGQVQHAEFNTVGEIIQTVQQIVDAKVR